MSRTILRRNARGSVTVYGSRVSVVVEVGVPAPNDNAYRQFQVERCLGRGGFGEVYEALMTQPGIPQSSVALKVLRDDVDPESGAIQRLKDEAELLARLNHPAILKVHDLTLLEGRITLITEYIEGADLDVCAEEDGSIPTKVMLQLMGIVADALDAAWNTRLPDGRRIEIVHRDIKPSNIRISKKGGVKLLDFGIARSDMVERRVKTSTGSLIGSPGYIAPERFLTDDSDPASDVFALGVVLFEGITGERLFDVRMTTMATMAVQAERYNRALNKGLMKIENKAVVDLLSEMMAHSPEDRPTAEQTAHRCHALASSLSGDNLKQWCSNRAWSEVEPVEGLLEGRVVTEHTLNQQWRKRNVDSRPPTSQSPNSQQPEQVGGGAMRVAITAVAGVAVLLVLLAIVTGVGAAAWLMPARNVVGSIDRVEPITQPAVTDEGDAFPEIIPEEKPQAAPRKARSRPSSQPVVQPEVLVAPKVEPVIEQAKPSEPVEQATYSFAFAQGSVTVELRRDGQPAQTLPARVATGEWDVFAQFNGRDFVPAGTVNVVEGEKLIISCNDVFLQCRAK